MTERGGADALSLLSSPVRRAIVDALADLRRHPPAEDTWPHDPGMSAAQLAELLDLHVTSVRFHLDQLVAAGLLRSQFERRGAPGRPGKVYSVEPGAFSRDREGASYRMLAGLMATHLAAAPGGTAPTPAEAGAAWAHANVKAPDDATPAASAGAWLGKVGRMADALEDWGYTPELQTSQRGRTVEVALVDCPVLALARQEPAVVCGIHRGLIAGTLERLGEADVSVGLLPFVGPNRCLARVTTHAPFEPARPPAA